MVWYAWVLVILYVIATLASIALIGKPRTSGEATLTVLINGLCVWAIVALAS